LLGELGFLGTTNMYAYCANTPVMYQEVKAYVNSAFNGFSM